MESLQPFNKSGVEIVKSLDVGLGKISILNPKLSSIANAAVVITSGLPALLCDDEQFVITTRV